MVSPQDGVLHEKVLSHVIPLPAVIVDVGLRVHLIERRVAVRPRAALHLHRLAP